MEPSARWRTWWNGLRRTLIRLSPRQTIVPMARTRRSELPAFIWGESQRGQARAIETCDLSGPEARARALLLRMLTPQQRCELEQRDCFTVDVAFRGRFVILPRRTLNVLNLETGECYCCITATDVPLSDLMLTQKLLLEHDPDHFFAIANCPSEFLFGPAIQPRAVPGRRRIQASSLSALPFESRSL